MRISIKLSGCSLMKLMNILFLSFISFIAFPQNKGMHGTISLPGSSVTTEQIVAAHNTYRKELNLPALIWSDSLSRYAESWAIEVVNNRNCGNLHRSGNDSDPWKQLYGENIYKSTNPGNTILSAVEAWATEKKIYDQNPKLTKGAGHYSQMIWKETTEVGCAIARCSQGVLVVCNYNPKGNIKGTLIGQNQNANSDNPPGSTVSANQILSAHNAYRSELKRPPLKWSSRLTDSAAAWANEIVKNANCQILFRSEDKRYTDNLDMGENIYKGNPGFSIITAINNWGLQKKNFNNKTNTCIKGDCESYRNMIRMETTEVGCAAVSCEGRFTIIVCNYNNPEGSDIKPPLTPETPVVPVKPIENTSISENILAAHNVYRTELGLPVLTWSPKLAEFAQAWGNELVSNRNCIIQNRPRKPGDPWEQKYGENIYTSTKAGFSIVNAVEIWGSKKMNYDSVNKTCMEGKDCKTYTQIIGSETKEVGCALVKCPDGRTIVVCNYDPMPAIRKSSVTPVPTVQPSDNSVTTDQILAAHNAYRTELGLPLLSWSPKLAEYAIAWGNELVKNRNCKPFNRPRNANDLWNQKFGENIYWNSNPNTTILTAINSWGRKKENFDPVSKTCAKGECGSYTQMIWKETTQVGCALVKCPDGAVIVVCNYDPMGNTGGNKPF